MITADAFLGIIESGLPDSAFRTATIATDYPGGPQASVLFDGETIPTQKAYLTLESDIAPDDKVLLAKVGHTFVIVGIIGKSATRSIPAVRARAGVAQTGVPANFWTTIIYDTEDEDTHGAFDPTASILTIPTGWDGLWLVTASVATNVRTAGNLLYMRFLRNTTIVPGRTNTHANGVDGDEMQLQHLIRVVSGDAIKTQHYQATAAVALRVSGTEIASTFEAIWLRT